MTTAQQPQPAELGQRRPVTMPTGRGRRRRPTGAPPPLPRSIGGSGRGWLIALALLVVWAVITSLSAWARRATEQVDAAILRAIAGLRTEWATTVFRAIDRAATGWTMSVAALVLLLSMVVFRRWRHLFTFLGSVVLLVVVAGLLIDAYTRPRPFDVTIIGRWDGPSMPSTAAAVTSFTVVGFIYATVVPGRPRGIAKLIGTVVVALVCTGRLYLGIDHPFDVLVGVAMGVGLPLLGFRFFTPNELVPVTYRGGKTAHLDVGGRRGEAIKHAVRDQLGLTVVDVRPFGLAGSGGSTPLRLRVAGEPEHFLFGKLYAMNHVRADRWYKLGRRLLYGRLEDERPYQSVHRLVQYEDYALRLLRDAGLPTAEPMGIVELTPGREYMIVTQFFDGAIEIGDADVDDQLIDEGLGLIRQLWDAGIAHRDIKPANLLVKDGHLRVIDVAFAQARPSPWREAVDLANMMLVLAVRTDADRVYGRALAFFSPDEIAEAFAAARGIASPTQLRAVMKSDGRDLIAQFRALAPQRPPIPLQRWSLSRVGLAAALALFALAVGASVYRLLIPVQLSLGRQPACGTNNVMVLMAQAVPTAETVPCVVAVPTGWNIRAVEVERGRGHFEMAAPDHVVVVTLRPPGRCSVDDATEVPSDQLDMRRYEQVTQLPPNVRATRTYVAAGACVTYSYQFDGEDDASLIVELDPALGFQPRAELVDAVSERTGLTLCGAGAPPCTGGPP
jgi:membrane-associated phospholipid phosphatase